MTISESKDALELAHRVRAKVRAKWGGKPEECEEFKYAGMDLSGSNVGVGAPVIRGILKDVSILPKTGDFDDWRITLFINGSEFHTYYRISTEQKISMRHKNWGKVVLRDMVNQATSTVMDNIRQGIIQDILEIGPTAFSMFYGPSEV